MNGILDKKTNPFAKVGLICSILLIQPIGLILCIIAIVEIRKNRDSQVGLGLAITGLVWLPASFLLAWLLSAWVFRSFTVIGPSMEDTLYTGERVIVNRLPVAKAAIFGQEYTPKRGQIIVFNNPQSRSAMEEYIIKRVVALSGETIDIRDCSIKVYNSEHPNGFNPYDNFDISSPNDCVSGNVENYIVPHNKVFVIGDRRNGRYSHDSRDGIGNENTKDTQPSGVSLTDVIGPVGMRVSPMNRFSIF
jgi:signal peptidase I